MLTHLQNNYGQLMPHELLEREYIVKKRIYNPRYPMATVFSAFEGILEFSYITGMSYMQDQAMDIAYVILHRTGNFGLEIRKWNCMKTVQRTWVRFKQFFCTTHQELRETSDLTVEDSGMQHANTVRSVVAGLQEALRQEKPPTDNVKNILEPIDHVVNKVKITQQQLATQLHNRQEMMKAMQIQYATVQQNYHQDYGGRGYHSRYTNYRERGGRGVQRRGHWHSGQSGRGNIDLTHYCWNHVDKILQEPGRSLQE